MLKALAWKESRELAPFIVLASLVQLFLVATATGNRTGLLAQNHGVIPFINDSMLWWMFCVAGIATSIMALWQTWWESSRGTFLFLLHRPASRVAIISMKLAIGVAILLALSVLPVLVYSLWAAAPGTHASPFEWSMTAFAWRLCAAMPLVYLGAFLSGLRPARWYGSRFFPLFSSLFLLIVCMSVSYSWPALAMLASLALQICYVVVILHVAATRDFS